MPAIAIREKRLAVKDDGRYVYQAYGHKLTTCFFMKTNTLLLFFALACFPLAVKAQDKSASLEEILSKPEFWKLSQDAFMDRYGRLGFRWTSDTKDSARVSGGGEKLSVKDATVGETIITFADGVPKQVQVSIFNRGDDAYLREIQFNGELQKWNRILSSISGAKPEKKARDNKSAVKTKGVVWNNDNFAYLLEYSSKKERGAAFRGEFIRLRMAPIVKKSFMEEQLSGPVKRMKKSDLPNNVVREDGDVYIKGIPMVDQGQKGYCVVAATARMFGYYKLQVDQHEIAQIANSSASGGTSTSGMIDALKSIAGRFKMRIKTHDAMDYQDMVDLSEDYNRIAKRADAKRVPAGGNVNNWYNFDYFDPEILRATRLKSRSGIKKFEAEIKRSIDAGIPLLWTVTVGIYKEPVRISQSRGGHMRMIIGYNTAKKEVIFSDTWGAGHEKKHWGIEEAYCSTKGLYSIQPTM